MGEHVNAQENRPPGETADIRLPSPASQPRPLAAQALTLHLEPSAAPARGRKSRLGKSTGRSDQDTRQAVSGQPEMPTSQGTPLHQHAAAAAVDGDAADSQRESASQAHSPSQQVCEAEQVSINLTNATQVEGGKNAMLQESKAAVSGTPGSAGKASHRIPLQGAQQAGVEGSKAGARKTRQNAGLQQHAVKVKREGTLGQQQLQGQQTSKLAEAHERCRMAETGARKSTRAKRHRDPVTKQKEPS